MPPRNGRSGFRPTLIPTLITVPALLMLLVLGSWQVQRHFWKEELNRERAAAAAAPAVDLPARVADPAALEFRPVRATGVFRHDRELFVNGRSQRGNPGYHVITPLERPGGETVLVNRGWVPYERKAPDRRAAGQVTGPVAVEGLLRDDARRGMFMPDNDPAKNVWFWYDLPAMSRAAGIDPPARFYVEAGPAPNPGGFPIGGQTLVTLPANHLQYALTWYALAVAVAAIYILYHRRLAR